MAFSKAQHALSLTECLDIHAAACPDALAFLFLKDGESEDGRLSYAELRNRASQAARAMLARTGPAPRVLLLFPQGLDFVVAFFAVLYAGGAAVPAPSPQGNRGTRARLRSVASAVAPDVVLTAADLVDKAAAALDGCKAPAPVSLTELEADPSGIPLPEQEPAAIAFIQYTSGSTGDPKGVVVTHANLVANMKLICERFSHAPETVTVNWLPVFHDMGLVGGTLQPVFLGGPCIMMSPVAFLQDPSRWLRAISRYGGRTSGAPNFAYDYCARRIGPEKKAGLDLSGWDCAFNGSEPVRAATLERFLGAFAECGFRREALYPTYGMAETTLFIAGGDRSTVPGFRETSDGLRVSSGNTGSLHEVLVVDPETFRSLPEGETGEIWFAGPSVSPGYLNRPEVNAEVFGQTPAGSDDPRFLRTGDLGFMRSGEVFVTGRIKDVIIVRGRNHYPHDIEATAQASHPALRVDAGAAVMVPRKGGEALVIVNELVRSALRDPPVAEIAGAVRATVSESHGLYVAAVVLLKTGGIPKTSSGKVQRRQIGTRYPTGDLPIIAEDRHGTPFGDSEAPDSNTTDNKDAENTAAQIS